MTCMHDILFIGDIHGAVGHVFNVVRQRSPKAVVFLGDLEPQADFPDWLTELQTLTTVRLIHGNHDTDSVEAHDRMFDPRVAPLNLHGRVGRRAGHAQLCQRTGLLEPLRQGQSLA